MSKKSYVNMLNHNTFSLNEPLYSFIHLAMQLGLWDPSSLTRDETQSTAMKAQNPNHQATRELSHIHYFDFEAKTLGYGHCPQFSLTKW